MQNSADIIRKIEEQFPVEIITTNGLPVWQFLRNIYADRLEKKELLYPKMKSTKIRNGLFNYFWQRQNRKKQFSAMLFTDTLEERTIDGKITDKIAHPLLQYFGNDILIINHSLGKRHRNISDYAHRYYQDIQAFTIPAKFKQKYETIENKHLLTEINQYCQFSLDFQKFVNSFFALARIFQHRFVKVSPKIIFINCYFSLVHQAVILGAKRQKIKTVELQHGIISKMLTPYFPPKSIGKETFPDFFLSYGKSEKKRMSTSFILEENIIPVGNFYLERIKNQTADDATRAYFDDLHQNYQKIITISSQNTIEKKLLAFIPNVAKRLPDVGFVFVPRKYEKFSNPQNLPQNIIINSAVDLYWNARFSDIHATVFSSFALESLFLGTPTILIDLDGLAVAYYSEILGSNPVVIFAKTPEDFVKIVENWKLPSKKEIEQTAESLFAKNNEATIRRFLDELL